MHAMYCAECDELLVGVEWKTCLWGHPLVPYSEHGAAPRTRGVRSSGLLARERSETGNNPSTGGQPGIAPASEASRGNIPICVSDPAQTPGDASR